MDHCFITTHIICNSGVLLIYFCVIFCKTRPTLHFADMTMPFLWPRAEQTQQQLMVLASVGCGGC
jgi:hypothetical protein